MQARRADRTFDAVDARHGGLELDAQPIEHQGVDVLHEAGEVPGRLGTAHPQLEAPGHGLVPRILADAELDALRLLRQHDAWHSQ